MNKSIEYNLLGCALSSYFIVGILIPFNPFGSKMTIIASIIALFFPFLSRKSIFFLCGLAPSGVLLNYPSIYMFLLPWVDGIYLFDLLVNTEQTIGLNWMSPELFTHIFILLNIAFWFIEPIIFYRAYKKIGLYDKLPFIQSSIA